jgi:phage regulator Rha-like protein
MEELLSIKELAQKLKRSESYVFAMKRRGFRMVANRTTMTAAIKFLAVNPSPCSRVKRSEVR